MEDRGERSLPSKVVSKVRIEVSRKKLETTFQPRVLILFQMQLWGSEGTDVLFALCPFIISFLDLSVPSSSLPGIIAKHYQCPKK